MASYYTELDEDRGWDSIVEEDERRREAERRDALVIQRRHTGRSEYEIAKAAAVGTRVVCGGCNKGFLKRTYQQAFCSNKGRGNCKDAYWNAVNPRGNPDFRPRKRRR